MSPVNIAETFSAEMYGIDESLVWPDTLVARNLRVQPIAPGVVYGTYCYTMTQKDTTSSGVSERVFVKTTEGWRIAITTRSDFRPALPRSVSRPETFQSSI